VLSSRNPEEAAETLRARHDVRIEIVPGSVAEPAVAAALAETASGLGGASAFLLNHGGPPVKPLMAITDEDWSQSFEIMVNGPLRVLRALVPQMQEAESGRVVAVSSFTVKSPYAGIGLSNSLRAALVNALKTAALELGPEGIMLNALACI
jgi:3-oxoacyl-[acyl-carrier protein] reductase